MNENRAVLDSAVTAACRSGQSLVRGSDGALIPADTPTPGYPNSEAGAKAWQEALAQRSGGTLELSEIQSSNTLYAAPDGNFYDWIEVHNPSDSPASLRLQALGPHEQNEVRFPGRNARRGRI